MKNNRYTHIRTIFGVRKYITCVLSLLFVLSSCETAGENDNNPANEGNITLDTRNVSQELMDNVRLFLFDGDNRNNAIGQYYGEIAGISRNNNLLSARVQSGKWDIGMVTCEDNPLTNLKAPVTPLKRI